jgi:cytochrome P450
MTRYHPAHTDFLAPDVRRDPYPYLAYLRHESPVHWMPALNAFLVTRYDDIAAILRDPETFSSIAMRRQAPGRDPHDRSGNSVITSDPPEHTRLRRILQDEFRMRPLRELEPRIRDLVDELRDRLLARPSFDLVRDFTIPLPVTVIAELLDIEKSRQDDFKHWSDCLIKLLNDREGEEWLKARAGVFDLIKFFGEVFDERSAAFADRHDILSVLLRAEQDERINRREMIAYSILLLTGGNETTTNLIGGMVLALRDHPEQLALLREEPARIPNAIEEGLRYCSPVQGVYRRAMRDVEVAGVTIPAQADVVTVLASANHDESKFSDPERFDVLRHTGGQAGFGMGIHHCLGAHLGRLEARVAFEWLVPQLHRLAADFDQVTWNDNWFVRGPETLPFHWKSA